MSERPAWCPDAQCVCQGARHNLVCGGVAGGFARLCLRFDAPCGVRTLDRITTNELIELRGLLDCMDAEGTTPRKEEVERRLEQPPRATPGAVAEDAIGPDTPAFLRKQAD